MAPPLSSELPLSCELQSVFTHAKELASHEGQPVFSTHLLLALYSVDNNAAIFLEENHLPAPTHEMRQQARSAREPLSTVTRIYERSHRLAAGARSHDVTSIHLLAAMLRESNSAAYRLLEAGGINVSGIRTRVMSYATGSRHITRAQLESRGMQPEQGHYQTLEEISSVPSLATPPPKLVRERAPRPIDFHPGLQPAAVDTSIRRAASFIDRGQRTRRRAMLEERSSPVHPALHDAYVRTTPSNGLPAVRREQAVRPLEERAEEISGAAWIPERPQTGSFIPPSGLLRQQAPVGFDAPEAGEVDLETDEYIRPEADELRHPTGSYKSLKERFAELKAQARKRHKNNKPKVPDLPPEKIPPAARQAALLRQRATRELARVEPPHREEPAPPAQEVEQPEDNRAVAMEDARDTTKDLAARLFGKAPRKNRREQSEEIPYEKDPLVQPGAAEMLAEVEITSATLSDLQESSVTSTSAPKQETRRPDPKLATVYRLDPEEYPILAKFGRNITEEAALLRVDPVVGRDSEITSLIDILGKRRGNNPLLVGDPGVGKTAIVEGLAHKFVEMAQRNIVAGERSIIELELGRLLSGTHLRGSLSERLIAIKDEVRKAAGQVIVFLDEIHMWLNAGNSGDGGDASGELKTALARGQFPCIGATTNDEFTRFVEADPAFERRFQIVNVEEPDIPTAVVIARGIREHYELHHGITYADQAIDAAVRLSHRYIHDRRLPDKAINVLDLAGSRAARQRRTYVRRSDVAHIVAEMAQIPADRLTQSDRARFLRIEEHLRKCVIGHDHVIHATAEVLRRNYAGFRSKRPIGSLLFLGPTGVGKTELVKALADFLFHDADAIVRLDMSEFMEAHAVSRFIGAPPGYVGYEQGGQLTEALRKRPYQVVLLDEIEKAHPDVLNLLLQLFDEGRLTDGRGRVVDFSNALIVMTSNLGAHIFDKFCEEETRARIGFGGMSASAQFENQEALSEQVCLAAREHFTPELWNRMNEHLVFMPLTQDEVAQIAVLQLEDSNRRLQEESGISLDFSQEVILYLIQNGGYDRKFGARPMRHTIQRAIEGQLARLILSGELERGDTVFIDVDDAGELCFFAQEREASN